jgi:hypothetical protein
MCDLGRAGLFDLRDVGIRPDDFGTVVIVLMLDALARVTSDLA